MEVTNQVRETRTRRGLSAADLADRIGVSRQTVHAIESGAYAPNTAVALKLARELGVGVEDLFHLEGAAAPQRVEAALVGGPAYAGAPLRLGRVGERMVAAPWSPEVFALPLADAASLEDAASGSVQASLHGPAPDGGDRLLLAGCDPASSLLAEHLRRAAGVELIAAPSSSRKALEWLEAGLVHVAGTHLRKGAARIPAGCRVFTFAEWEEGLVTAPGNPKNLRSFADLAGRRIINRELGAGARSLLDAGLEQAGVAASTIDGYDRIAPGHLAAAWAVRRGEADCCVAPRVAARVFGLSFTPLASERYDFVVPEQWLTLPAMQALLDALQRSAFRRELDALGGYDTSATGAETQR
ncbi:MAG: helix-turn-helix domain-containing protein [Acidobacteria bacterium]|nr:helix-turn-helix domain-containing protein [Acidobacteriota bacterium]